MAAGHSIAARLQSCSNRSEASEIHGHVLRLQLLPEPYHWNALMRCYLRLVLPSAALLLFVQMTRAGSTPDRYSLPIALKAAFTSFSFSSGLQLHSTALKLGLSRHEFSESALISLYAKAGLFAPARQLFDENPQRRLGSWNALISCCAHSGRSHETVALFAALLCSGGALPDQLTVTSVASASAGLADPALASQIHRCAIRACRPGPRAVPLWNSLIDMYAKCGRTDLALLVFDEMPERDVSSWTAMIMGLVTQGSPGRALDLFHIMEREGVAPNHVTMVAALCACSHAGLVDEGMRLFTAVMAGRFRGVRATEAHYGCVADMLGKVGRVVEAAGILEGMPGPPSAVAWGALLGACEKHGEVAIGERAAAELMELEPWNDGVYVVLSNIYAASGMWHRVESVRRLMRSRKVGKNPGYSLPALSSSP